MCLETSIGMSLLRADNSLNFCEFTAYLDALPPVCELSWLDNPNIPDDLLLDLGVRTCDLLKYLILPFCKGLFEPQVIGTIHPTLEVERQWEVIEDVLLLRFEVRSHVVEQGLLVAQVEVVLQVVVELL
jgi:hypothetical protein